MAQRVISTNHPVGFVRALSGLFITKENPVGIPPKEITIAAAFLFVLSNRKTDKIETKDREEVAKMTNNKVQVVTNYANKLKKRGVIDKRNRLHPIFFNQEIKITRWTV